MKINNQPYSYFPIQWHLTARCQLRCAHCYVPENDQYKKDIKNEIPADEVIFHLKKIAREINQLGFRLSVNFTGGDPLLYPGLIEVLKFCQENNIVVSLMANPFLLTRKKTEKLRTLGVRRIQVSIDGLEKTHDRLRGKKGAYKATIKAINILNEEDIKPQVMFTVNKFNKNDLIRLMEEMAKRNVFSFTFGRLVPTGRGKELNKLLMQPQEYRKLLLAALEKERKLNEQGYATFFLKKDHLWFLLFDELGLNPPLPPNQEKIIFKGCGLGWKHLTICADGTILACRRMPYSLVGNIKKDSVACILTKSKKMKQYRRVELLEKCSGCHLLYYCRGCPAVAEAASGKYSNADPQCWKKF